MKKSTKTLLTMVMCILMGLAISNDQAPKDEKRDDKEIKEKEIKKIEKQEKKAEKATERRERTPGIGNWRAGNRQEAWSMAGGGPGGAAGVFNFRVTEEDIKKYDQDGDGKLTGEERKAMMEDRFQEEFKQMDKDGDGKIDRDEFLNFRRERLQEMEQRLEQMRERIRENSGERIRNIRQRMDIDGDGVVTPEEAKKAAEEIVKRFSERGAVGPLQRFDKDGDGKLSPEEHQEAINELMQRMQRGDQGEEEDKGPRRNRDREQTREKKEKGTDPEPL